ncbi:MAG: ParB/RepB/Spo0J family partition protein, partial [Deltaproteobacteria bacterium]
MPETFHTVELISVERIRANDYNPNAMAAKTYEQLVASIKGRGFRSAIYVLPADQDGVHTIVDGEHRWRAAKESGLLHVPCVVLPANQDEAMMDTIAMNQLRGGLVPVKVALVIAELSKRIPVDVLEKELGFEDHELEDQLELLKLPDDINKTIELQAEMEEREALQVVTFVMRKPQAELVERVVDELEKELGGPNPRGRALETIVRKYLEVNGQPVSEEVNPQP